MSEKAAAVKALKLFNEKAEELLSSTFTKKVLADGTSVTLQLNLATEEEKNNSERIGPNKEDIKAFLLDFRFFIQNNEISSFRNLKTIYSSDLLKAKFETRFDFARDELNRFLDSPSILEPNGTTLAHRQITDTFVYGGFAHAKEKKAQLFKKWQKEPDIFLLIENRFIFCLMKVLYVINITKNLNVEALKDIETIR